MARFDLHFTILRGILDKVSPGWVANMPYGGFNKMEKFRIYWANLEDRIKRCK